MAQEAGVARRVTETLYYVKDMSAAIQFYTERLGMRLLSQQDWGFALLAADESHNVGLLDEKTWKAPRHHDIPLPVPRLSFQTDDFDGEVERMRASGVTVEIVSADGAAIKAAVFRDQDENPFFLWDDGTELPEE